MDFVEVLFLLQFLAVLGILGIKTYNVMRQGGWYDLKLTFLGFAAYFMAFGVGFVVTLFEYDTLIYGQLFRLEQWTILYLVVIFFAELFLQLSINMVKPIQAYNSKKEMAAMAKTQKY